LTDNLIYSLAVSGTGLFAGTSSSGIFLSTNNGATWRAVNTGLMSFEVFLLPFLAQISLPELMAAASGNARCQR